MLCEAFTDIVIHAQSSTVATLVFCAEQPSSSSAETVVQGGQEAKPLKCDQDAVEAESSSATGVNHLAGERVQPDEPVASPKRQRLSHEEFHSSLR